MVKLRRVYEGRQAGDGLRILVDRLWPRGLTAAKVGIDEWMKDIAPSDDLRKWFSHKPERWEEFRQKYIEELSVPEKAEFLNRLVQMAKSGDITLVFGAKDTERNNAQSFRRINQ
jgi:uncharacterized protein YeaO (DUF488 family)